MQDTELLEPKECLNGSSSDRVDQRNYTYCKTPMHSAELHLTTFEMSYVFLDPFLNFIKSCF